MGRGGRGTSKSPALQVTRSQRTRLPGSWSDNRIVTFDVESTGLDTDSDRILTASVIFVGGGQPTESHSWLINPGVKIPEDSIKIHGVTQEEADKGDPPEKAIQEITKMLSEAADSGSAVVAYNARFDITMLDREAKRHGVAPLSEDQLVAVVDPFVLDKAVDPDRRESRKLVNVCEHYGIPFDEDDAHAADVDSLNAARLAYRICKRHPELVDQPLDSLAEKQVEWAKEQAADLQAYFDSKGKDAHVDPEWPLVPEKN